MVILQSYLGAIDGATALSIGWHLSVVGQLYEQNMWEQSMLNTFANEIVNGALVNRAVSEAKPVVLLEVGPGTHAVKEDNGYVLNGVKTFTSMSKSINALHCWSLCRRARYSWILLSTSRI